jgi:predicted double-glycine peptidase
MNVKDIFAQNGLAIQQESYTCGPTSLLNILRLKGDVSHSEPELSKICKAKPGIGTSHEDLVKAAQQVGLELAEQKSDASIEDLERGIDAGAYVIVNYFHVYSGEGHYGLVTEYDDEALYFRDCSCGFFRIKKKFFKNFWYGDAESSKQWYAAFK